MTETQTINKTETQQEENGGSRYLQSRVLSQHPLIRAYLGDCMEKMKDIPDGSIDAVVSDPPLFLLNKCICFTMASRTKTNKIRKIIGSFIITIKKSIRLNMVNIYEFLFSTFLAGKIISFKCFSFLRLPIRTSFDYPFANIVRVVNSFSIFISARTTAPLSSIFLSFKLAFQKIKMIATIKTSKYYFFFCKFFRNRNALTGFTAIFTSTPFQSAWAYIKFLSTSFANGFHIINISKGGIICK